MKKQIDAYVPKTEYSHKPEDVFNWYGDTVYVTTTLDLKVIHPEPRVVDLRPTKE